MVLMVWFGIFTLLPVVFLQNITLVPSPVANVEVGDTLSINCMVSWKGNWTSLILDEQDSNSAALGFFTGSCENHGPNDVTRNSVTCDPKNLRFSLIYHEIREIDNGKTVICEFSPDKGRTIRAETKINVHKVSTELPTTTAVSETTFPNQGEITNLVCRKRGSRNHLDWTLSTNSSTTENVDYSLKSYKLSSATCPTTGNYSCDVHSQGSVNIPTIRLDIKCDPELVSVQNKSYQIATVFEEGKSLHLILDVNTISGGSYKDEEIKNVTFLKDRSFASFDLTINSNGAWYYLCIEKADIVHIDPKGYYVEMGNSTSSVFLNFTQKYQPAVYRWSVSFVSIVFGGPLIVLVLVVITTGLICTVRKRRRIKIQIGDNSVECPNEPVIYQNNARIIELEAPEPYDNLEEVNYLNAADSYEDVLKIIPEYIEVLRDESLYIVPKDVNNSDTFSQDSKVSSEESYMKMENPTYSNIV